MAEGTHEPPRLTPDEVTTLARRVVTNEVFMTNSEEGLDAAFGTILALSGSLGDHWRIASIGAIYEELSKAGTHSMNGYPMFLSCQFLHADDLPLIRAELDRMNAALGLADA